MCVWTLAWSRVMKITLFVKTIALVLLAAAVLSQAAIGEEEEARRIVVKCDAPATNYKIEIESVWRVGNELWAVSKISKIGDLGGAAITPVRDEVSVMADADLPLKHYISGKTWNWWEGVDCTFIDSKAALLKQMKKDGTKIDEVLHGDDPR